MAEFGSAGPTQGVEQSFTFPGDLNNQENDFIPIQYSPITFTVSKLKVVLDGDGQNPPSGADVKVDFYKIVLATSAKTLIGRVTVTAGQLVGETTVSPGVQIVAGIHGTRAQIVQVGSVNPGHTGTFTASGG